MIDRAPDTTGIKELLLAVSDGGRDALDPLLPLLYNDRRESSDGMIMRAEGIDAS